MSSNEAGEDNPTGEQQTGTTWRACDNCRARKIRCDKGSPCSNCRTANATCRTARKPKEQRQRILISNQYEKKIELIDDRLSRIERTLHSIANNPASLPQKSSTGSPAASSDIQSQGLPILSISDQHSGPFSEHAPFEGETSFSAQTMQASRLVEKAIDHNALPNTEMAAALSSLRNIVEKQNSVSSYQDCRFPAAQQDTSPADISKMELPPVAVVLSVLRICKESRPRGFADLPFLNTDIFTKFCQRVYFSTEDYPLSVFTLVNGGLHYLFLELMLTGDGKPEYEQYSALCRSNFERAFASYPLLCAPTVENLQALLLGALYAIDTTKPSICWTLTSSAARLCQALGYHRASSLKGLSPAEVEEQQGLFWFVYVLDKSLSLRLGQSSVLQDYDIDVTPPKMVLSEPCLYAWNAIYLYWVELAELHGLAYEKLYSPRALGGNEEERTRNAKALIVKLEQCQEGLSNLDITHAYASEYLPVTIASCQTVCYSLLTIFYRAIPPTASDVSSVFNDQCVQAARASLKAHQKCAQDYGDGNSYIWHGYLSWSLIHCPFAPFTVVFCNAIETSNLEDLQCLGGAVATLQSSADLSEGVDKLYRLCSVFYQVAKLYIESKLKLDRAHPTETPVNPTDTQGDVPMHAGGEFDPYLNALGLDPSGGFANMPPQGDATMEEYEPRPSASLGNWFTGNLNMLGLLEVDLTDLDTW